MKFREKGYIFSQVAKALLLLARENGLSAKIYSSNLELAFVMCAQPYRVPVNLCIDTDLANRPSSMFYQLSMNADKQVTSFLNR